MIQETALLVATNPSLRNKPIHLGISGLQWRCLGVAKGYRTVKFSHQAFDSSGELYIITRYVPIKKIVFVSEWSDVA